MSTEEVTLLATRPQVRLKFMYVLILAGLMVEMVALVIGIALGVSAGKY